MPLDLLVPDLLVPIDAPASMRALRLPALEKWLEASRVERAEALTATGWLASEFRLAVPAPVAPISLAAESRVPDGAWLRADPVHVRIGQNAMTLHSAAILDIERAEADALLAALQDHFRGDGFEFAAPSPERWYVRVPRGELPDSTPLEEALGRDMLGLLPVSRGALNWRSTLTEAQMLLAAHEVNLRREKAGRPAINSVWFWGGGELPAHVAAPYRTIHADDVFARGLATLSGARLSGAPAALADIPPVDAKSALVMIDALSRALDRGDDAAWCGAATALERGWFGHLRAAIDRFGGVRVILPAAKDTLVATLERPALLHWLRAPKALSTYA